MRKSIVHKFRIRGRIQQVIAGIWWAGTDPTTYFYDNTTGLLDRVRHQVGSHDDDVFYSYDNIG